MPEANRRRGTPMHGLQQFGSDALSQFLSDLNTLTNGGLEPSQCKSVVRALSDIEQRTSRLPPNSFVRRMWDKFPPFREAYERWNEKDTDRSAQAVAHRKEKRVELRNAKAALYNQFNSDQMKLEEELDGYDLVHDLYKPFEQLVNDHPKLFPELASAVTRYRRFRPGGAPPPAASQLKTA